MRIALALTVLIFVSHARPAHAQVDLEIDLQAVLDRELGQFLATAAKRALDRARRAYVLGPYVGGAAVVPFEGDADGALSFGIGLTKFAIPIFPSRQRVIDAAKKRLLERLLTVRKPTEAEAKQFVSEIVAEVIAELLLELNPRRFEKPGLATRLEGNYAFDSGAFDARVTIAIGISKVFVGTGLVLRIDDGAAFVVPVEISLPMTLSKGKRTPLLDFFGRIDFAVTGRDERVDAALVGARLHLDII